MRFSLDPSSDCRVTSWWGRRCYLGMNHNNNRKVHMSAVDTVKSWRGTIASPVRGNAIPLSEVPDPVFSGGALGSGCGVRPTSECVVSPFSGTVTMTTPTDHAIGLTSDEGVELLVHVGIDTVEMGGEGFARLVEQGEHVAAGDPVLSFTRSVMRDAGHDDVVIIVVPGRADVKLAADGPVEIGSRLLRVG